MNMCSLLGGDSQQGEMIEGENAQFNAQFSQQCIYYDQSA